MGTPSRVISKKNIPGLSILLLGSGTVDIHRSMQTCLIEIGCKVFWHPSLFTGGGGYPELKEQFFAHPIDLVFHFSIFTKGTEYINQLRKLLDINNPEAIIVNMPLSHPVIDIIALGLKSVADLNKFFKDRRIVQWSICRISQKEWEQYGLTSSFFLPLGLTEHYFFTSDDQQPRGNWFDSNSDLKKLKYNEMSENSFSAQADLIRDKIVYAGAPNSSWEKIMLPVLIRNIGFLTENFLSNSKEEFGKLAEINIEPGNIKQFIRYHFLWSLHVPLERRRKMIQLISKKFKGHISIWGDGWEKYISTSYPTSVAPRYFYKEALCCLDFGSLSFDTALFPRTNEIVKLGGLLISGRTGDKTDLVRENQFETGEQLIHIIEEAFDPMKRKIKMEQQKTLRKRFDLNNIMKDVLAYTYAAL